MAEEINVNISESASVVNIALTTATGDDGREIELSTTSTHIVWRYSGEVEWNDLIALSELEALPLTSTINAYYDLSAMLPGDTTSVTLATDAAYAAGTDLRFAADAYNYFDATVTGKDGTYLNLLVTKVVGSADGMEWRVSVIGAKGDKGDKGGRGDDGSDASVTNENVNAAVTTNSSATRNALGAGAAGDEIFQAATHTGVGSTRRLMGLDATDSPTFANLTASGTFTGTTSVTGSSATSAIDLAPTWNTTGTPTAIKLNVTDTASNTNSLLMDLQVGGVSHLKVDKKGSLFLCNPSNFYNKFGWENALNFNTSSTSGIASIGSKNVLGMGNVHLSIPSTHFFGWNSGTNLGGGDIVLRLFMDAANVLAQRWNANPQEFRLYNTYTDASNYERLSLKANAGGAFTITSEAAGSGVVRELRLIGNVATIRLLDHLTTLLHNNLQGVTRDDGFIVTASRGYSFSNTSTSTGELALRRDSSEGLIIGNRFATERRDLKLRNLKSTGDIESETIGNGVIIKSPDGTRWRITVANDGSLTTTSL